MGDEDVAMVFFRGLDNARYAGFKTEILNGLTAKSITQPANLNAMYLLANQWVKPVTRGNAAGFASTFLTTLDKTEKQCGNQPEGGGRHKGGRQKGGKQQPSQDKKEGGNRKDTIECFACGEMGHYANKCPQKQADEGGFANATWQEEQEGQMFLCQGLGFKIETFVFFTNFMLLLQLP